LEALKDEYEITILSARQADFSGVNRFYGTSLRNTHFKTIYPKRLIQGLLRLDPDAGSIQPAAYLMRMCRRVRHHYDLVLAAGMEEMDLGGPGLLYVHYPHLARFWENYDDGRAGWLGLLRGKTRPWMLLAGYSTDRLKENTMLTNSNWTGDRIKEAYGIRARTVYPPVTPCHQALPWDERENCFVCAGRLHSRKRMDWVIGVLAKVRERHSTIRLHLIGTRDEGPEAAAYYRALQTLVYANREWVQLHEELSREDLLELLGHSRYAIHALEDEHFGIAPAEALMAGCIPFVHDSGGQIEIVGHEPSLCYRDEDAVQKVNGVLASEELQSILRVRLAARRELFTIERFMEEIRGAVRLAIA
jgi:glycosyltransferase involved in cell wall biosynthesis